MRIGRGQAVATAMVMLAVAVTGCRVERPPAPDPAVSGQINSLPPARGRHSVLPSTPPDANEADAWLVEHECSDCHTTGRVASTRLDWNGWRGEVGHMVQNGAVLTVQEQQRIVDYLAYRREVMRDVGWPPSYPGSSSATQPTRTDNP